jgi:hypothetical protein
MARYYTPKARHLKMKRREAMRLQNESKERPLLELEQELVDRFLRGEFDQKS